MTHQDWISMATSVGLPTAFLIGLLFILWRMARAVSPYFMDAYERHCELIEVLKDSASQCTNASRALSHAADALEVIADDDKIDKVKLHTRAMKDDLGDV